MALGSGEPMCHVCGQPLKFGAPPHEHTLQQEQDFARSMTERELERALDATRKEMGGLRLSRVAEIIAACLGSDADILAKELGAEVECDVCSKTATVHLCTRHQEDAYEDAKGEGHDDGYEEAKAEYECDKEHVE